MATYVDSKKNTWNISRTDSDQDGKISTYFSAYPRDPHPYGSNIVALGIKADTETEVRAKIERFVQNKHLVMGTLSRVPIWAGYAGGAAALIAVIAGLVAVFRRK